MTYQKKIILILSIISLTIYGCIENEVINTLQEGDYIISSRDYSLDSNGNLSFNCIYANNSDQHISELLIKVNYYYSPLDSSNIILYQQMSGNIISTAPNQYSISIMNFPALSKNCCNTCCPGTYICDLTLYSPDMSILITKHLIEVEIDSSNFIIKT